MNIYREPTMIRLEFESPEKAENFEMWLRFAMNLSGAASVDSAPSPEVKPPVRLSDRQLSALETSHRNQKSQHLSEESKLRRFRSGDFPWKNGRD